MKKLDLKNINAIIFDFGGVILNIDYYALVGAFRALGIENFDVIFSQAKQSSLFDDFEKGLTSNEQFIEEIKKIAGIEVSNQQIITAWNAILLDLPKERLKLILQIKKNKQTYLLSNTNNIHIDEFERTIEKQMGLNYFYSCFDKIYYSSRIKMRKPDPEIFSFVLNNHQLNASETLFIDDSVQHIQAAKKMGINSFLLEKGTTILDVL